VSRPPLDPRNDPGDEPARGTDSHGSHAAPSPGKETPVNPWASLQMPHGATPPSGNPRAEGSPAAGGEAPTRRSLRAAAPAQATSRSSRRSQLGSEPPRPAKRSHRGRWGCLIALVVLVALVAGAVFALQGPIAQLQETLSGPADYSGAGETKVIVMIHEGETGSDIANTLVAQDVVKSYDAFYKLLLKVTPAPVFQPGAYQLMTKMSASAALTALRDPVSKLKQTVVIPEGTAEAGILQLVSEGTNLPLADLQAASTNVAAFGLPAEAKTLEGFLFPATYTFPPGVTAQDALKTLVDRQFQALDEAGVSAANRWKTIVLASLIQREAGLAADYPKVARVFLNRLDPAQWESGLLQSDATVAYGTGHTNVVTTTDAERADAGNLYNTYVHPGLPVGPISNPGDVAITAALHPSDGTWLYFVTWNLDTGETIFSTTAAEHVAGVAKWQAWMKDHPEYG
jgi:uncharacterized YceG family protein